MYSSKAASTRSGCGAGSASSSKAEALTDCGGVIDCGGGKGAGVNGFAAAGGSAEPASPAGLAACPLRSRPRATLSVPLDCST